MKYFWLALSAALGWKAGVFIWEIFYTAVILKRGKNSKSRIM